MSKPQIFISHSLADSEWVRAFAEALQGQGARVWLDEWEVQPGASLKEAIEKGLRGSDIVVSVITPENVHLPNLLFELGAAVGMGKRVVAIIPRGMDSSGLPHPLRLRKSLFKESPKETAKKLLVESKADKELGESGAK